MLGAEGETSWMSQFSRGNSQAKVLPEDETLESFSKENTKGVAIGKSLRLKDRGNATRYSSVFLYLFHVILELVNTVILRRCPK